MQMSLTTKTPTQRHPKMFGRRLGAAAVRTLGFAAAAGDGRSNVTLTVLS
jgi:hypothetical protein